MSYVATHKFTTAAFAGALAFTFGPTEDGQAALHRGVESNVDCFDSSLDSAVVHVGPSQLLSAVTITELFGQELIRPMNVLIEPDEDAFLARSPDVPQIYGHGDTPDEALNGFIDNIEALWEDLNADDNFTDEWLFLKDYLNNLVAA